MQQDTNDPQPTAPTERPDRTVERPSPLTGPANAWFVLVAVVVFGGREVLEDTNLRDLADRTDWVPFALGALALVVLGSLVVGVIQWRTTTFVVDDEFRIERRFIGLSTTRIDFTKVQAVDVTRPFLARLLGLAEVKIDIGGEGGESLRFLSKARAEALRDTLLARMEPDDGAAPAPDAGEAEGPSGAEPPSGEDPDDVLFRARRRDVLLGALLAHGLSGLVGTLALVTIFLATAAFVEGGQIGLVIALVGILWQIPNDLLTNWNFQIVRARHGLRLQRGAFSRSQTTLRPNRVQTVTVRQSLFMRIAGLVSVHISVLGNPAEIEDANDGIDVLMPFGQWEAARYVIALVWPDVDPALIPWQLQDRRGKRLTWIGDRWSALGARHVATRRLLLGHEIVVVPYERVQGVGVTQGPLQRLAGVASAAVHTVDGSPDVELAHFRPQDARAVFETLHARSTAAREEREQARARA